MSANGVESGTVTAIDLLSRLPGDTLITAGRSSSFYSFVVERMITDEGNSGLQVPTGVLTKMSGELPAAFNRFEYVGPTAVKATICPAVRTWSMNSSPVFQSTESLKPPDETTSFVGLSPLWLIVSIPAERSSNRITAGHRILSLVGFK